MTVLSRGARVRRGGRRPGWVLLTALLVLAIGASSALVFTNRVELLKLAVILALWAAVAGAFVSVLYRRQSDADQARVRDLKLVYDLQLDREISARREYELTVESQLRRELASELRAQAADDLAELRAELSALRTSLEILFDTDLAHRPALGTVESEPQPERAYSEWDRNGETPRDNPVDWVPSDRVTSVPQDNPRGRADETAIIDVPKNPYCRPANRRHPVGNGPATSTNRPKNPRIRRRSRPTPHRRRSPGSNPASNRHRNPNPNRRLRRSPNHSLRPGRSGTARTGSRRPRKASGCHPGHRAATGPAPTPPGNRRAGGGAPGIRARRVPRRTSGRSPGRIPRRSLGRPARRAPAPTALRRVRPPGTVTPFGGVPRLRGAQFRPRHRATGPGAAPPPEPRCSRAARRRAPPPRLAPPPAPEHTPRHGGDPQREDAGAAGETTATGGQSVADLLARLQVQPSEGGRRRRREG
ncbi:putative conserved transmembrane protein rich in alanine, arginine and proline [Mycobacterium intracellulare 1956]|uniref:Putative conserved transmembrane protein rich in alanine, arginine and proline n=1 Tax=Mycobacterium intracellulare 1956 TaxID=1299331 RepID=X8CLV1_MYCIT|nr:putative conserved transmembrane protein rich in alanine, arginine and proline [Mycobacterium intracellulare 1956]